MTKEQSVSHTTFIQSSISWAEPSAIKLCHILISLLRLVKSPANTRKNEIIVNIVAPRSLQLSGKNFTLD